MPYGHRRRVEWLRTLGRDELPQKLKYSLGALLTVFNIDRHADTIHDLLTGKPDQTRPPKEVTGKELPRAIIDRLMSLNGQAFQKFISDLLGILGFEATITQYVGDKGIDVFGKLNAEGLTTLSLHVQVKRVSGSIGIDEVLKLRGTLGR